MKTKSKGMSYAKWGYIFLAPFFITFLIFQFWPLATTIYYSFFEYFRSGLCPADYRIAGACLVVYRFAAEAAVPRLL